MQVTIFTTNYCPYCMKAKQLMQSLDVAYREVDVTEHQEEREEASKKAGGWMTVPMIFIGDEFVGGYDDLAKLHAEGKFLEKVKKS